jgi:hypothetical protein
MIEEHCYMIVLSFFPNSWDNLVMVVGRTEKELVLDEVMTILLIQEMRRKDSK